MPTLEERMADSTTRIAKLVFPGQLSHHNYLFGGTALQWMDEAAIITGGRFSRQRLVTASLDRIDFKVGIPAGVFIELVGKVIEVGNSSMKVQIEIYIEQLYSEDREKAIQGLFTLVAVDEKRRPVPIRR